jgi:DNA-binding HxlR family transcriptional regulator
MATTEGQQSTPGGSGPGLHGPCRAREVFDRVGDKWSVSVIHQLGAGTLRFTDLRQGVEGISQRMLTVTLRGLERDGIVTRIVHPIIPPRVDYDLTPMGRTLLQMVGQLVSWAGEHLGDIDDARAAYDRRVQGPASPAAHEACPETTGAQERHEYLGSTSVARLAEHRNGDLPAG